MNPEMEWVSGKAMKSDAELVRGAEGGDEDAFGVLYKRHENSVMHYLIRRLPTRSDAEDVLQETFLKAWRNLEGLAQHERFMAWLLMIARNSVTDFFRRQARRHGISADELIDTLIDPAARPPECRPSPPFDRFLAKLTPREYEVCVLLCIEGLSVTEVAIIIDTTPMAVYTCIYRIRQKFKEFLKEQGDDI